MLVEYVRHPNTGPVDGSVAGEFVCRLLVMGQAGHRHTLEQSTVRRRRAPSDEPLPKSMPCGMDSKKEAKATVTSSQRT